MNCWQVNDLTFSTISQDLLRFRIHNISLWFDCHIFYYYCNAIKMQSSKREKVVEKRGGKTATKKNFLRWMKSASSSWNFQHKIFKWSFFRLLLNNLLKLRWLFVFTAKNDISNFERSNFQRKWKYMQCNWITPSKWFDDLKGLSFTILASSFDATYRAAAFSIQYKRTAYQMLRD